MKLPYMMIVACLATAASGQLTEDLKLTASDAIADDRFGVSVDIYGTTAIVGSFFSNDAGDDSGSAYLFDTTTGQELFKITASDAAEDDRFGLSVGISGSTAVVGAFLDDDAGGDSGSAYLFDATTGQELFKLTASDAAAGDWFGFAVAISGTTAIIGAPEDNAAFGSVYIFSTITGQQVRKLTSLNVAAGDRFGSSVAISGSTAIIGAPQDNSATGSVYVFNTITGQQLFKLNASDAAVADSFGNAVAIHGTTAIIGADSYGSFGFDSGAAYVFDLATGQELFKLTASDAAQFDKFGRSVDMFGTTAIIGSWFDDDAGSYSGSAYLFDTTTGQELGKLTASDASAGDYFGVSASISGSTAIVGAYRDDDDGSNSGSAYLFDLHSSPCPGDIADDFGTPGDDGMVSFGDFLALLGLIGPCPGGTPGCTGDIADDFGTLNGGDGMVSFGDFLALLGLIGPCP